MSDQTEYRTGDLPNLVEVKQLRNLYNIALGIGSSPTTDIIAELEKITQNTADIEITADSINLNTDDLETLIGTTNSTLASLGVKDSGPTDLPTVTNLKAVSLGSAQTLAAAPGAGLKAQIRDLFTSVDTDVRVSIYSGASTLFVGNLKANNGTIQLCPRQGFTGETNTAISMIATTASGTHDTTVNSVAV